MMLGNFSIRTMMAIGRCFRLGRMMMGMTKCSRPGHDHGRQRRSAAASLGEG